MTVVSGDFNPQLATGGDAGEWNGTEPTLDGLFMQYGVTTKTPAINSTRARTWKSVDPSDGGTASGFFYGLNTAEFGNFYVGSNTSGAATDGYGIAGAGMSLVDTNNEQAEHDNNELLEIASPGGTTSEVYAKRSFPQNYSIDPIAPGTIVVMHERWTASGAGEANYAGLMTPGGRSAGDSSVAVYDGTSPHTGPSLKDTRYSPAPPFYYFSMPNVFQGTCG